MWQVTLFLTASVIFECWRIQLIFISESDCLMLVGPAYDLLVSIIEKCSQDNLFLSVSLILNNCKFILFYQQV